MLNNLPQSLPQVNVPQLKVHCVPQSTFPPHSLCPASPELVPRTQSASVHLEAHVVITAR